MWRSIVGARGCAISLRRSATSYSTGKRVPSSPPQQVHRHVITSLNPSRVLFSTNAFESPNDGSESSHSDPTIPPVNRQFENNEFSPSDPTISPTHQHFDEKIEEFGENPISGLSEFDDDNELSSSDPKISQTHEHFDEKTEELGENQVSISSEFDDNVVEEDKVVVVQEVDLEQIESVLSLLQSSRKPDDEMSSSLDSTLDEMNLTSLGEEFVLRILETPLVPGENLIGFFKWALKKPDLFSPSSQSLEALVGAISGQKNVYAVWDLIKEIGEMGRNDGILTTGILNRLISLLSKLGKAKASLEVFNKFDDFRCVTDSDTYYFTIDVLCRRSFYDWACSVVEKMIGSGKLPDGKRVGKVISYLCRGEKYKEAHSVFLLAQEKDKSLPQSSINFLISSLSQNDETVHLGLEMLGNFSGEERKSAIKPFSSVIRGLCRTKDVGSAKDLLSKMIDEGPPPGNSVFNSIINALSKAGEMGEARNMVKLMESRGLKPDVFSYTVIISGYAKGGEMDEAYKVLGEAKAKHSKLATVTYHTLVRGYCKLGEFDKAVKLLGEMREFGVEPNEDEYNKLIQSLCLKALDWKAAEKLLDEMKEKGLQLNGNTVALLRAVKEMEDEVDAGSSGDGGEKAVAV